LKEVISRKEVNSSTSANPAFHTNWGGRGRRKPEGGLGGNDKKVHTLGLISGGTLRRRNKKKSGLLGLQNSKTGKEVHVLKREFYLEAQDGDAENDTEGGDQEKG